MLLVSSVELLWHCQCRKDAGVYADADRL